MQTELFHSLINWSHYETYDFFNIPQTVMIDFAYRLIPHMLTHTTTFEKQTKVLVDLIFQPLFRFRIYVTVLRYSNPFALVNGWAHSKDVAYNNIKRKRFPRTANRQGGRSWGSGIKYNRTFIYIYMERIITTFACVLC